MSDTYTLPRAWRLDLDMCGRPLTANKAHGMHPIAAQRARAVWRDAATVLARTQRIPALPAVTVTAQAHYRTRRSPSDTDAAAPTVKGVIDGLVLAGVIPDDTPRYVRSVTYRAPALGTGGPDGLTVWITAHDPAGEVTS